MTAIEPSGASSPRHSKEEDAQLQGRQPIWRRVRLIGLETAAAVVPALLFAAWASTIDVNPMERIGQVSAMAMLQFRFAGCAVVLVGAMMAAHRWGSERIRALSIRLGCAAVAGLATGLVGGGIVAALHGTPFSLWAGRDDFAPIIEALHTRDLSNLASHYPPLFGVVLGAWSWLSDQPAAYALKQLQIVGVALFGPAAYLSWRMVLRPQWALAVGVVATLPFVEPVKPYPQLTLVILVPVLVALLSRIRRSDVIPVRRAVLLGVGFGGLLGVLFLLYSGWFVWLVPGLLVAVALLVPWRTGLRSAMTLCGTTAIVFVAVSFVHLRGLFASSGGLSDRYFYFDTCIEPTYIATSFNDRPFYAGPLWPLPGELGGVGLFTVLLALGAGIGLLLGFRRTAVMTIGFTILSAWLLRMWLAGGMYETESVRLYPRTTAMVLYGLLLLTGLGVYYAAEAVRRHLERGDVDPARPRLAPVAILLIPLLFLFASAGSATINEHMPNQRADSGGWFAWIAHTDKQYDTGVCSPYAGDHCGEEFLWPENTPCAPGLEPTIEYRSLAADRRNG